MNRREAEELLPWFVAGKLSADETLLVQAFINSGEISASEIEELTILAETVATVGEDEPAYNPEILTRVMSQLDDVKQAEPDPLPVSVARTSRRNLFQALVEIFEWSLTPPFAKIAIGVQFALLFGILFTINTGDTPSGEQAYETVAGTRSTLAHHGDLTVMFSPDVSESEVRALLLGNDAKIVSGPSALGVYTIDLADDTDVQAIQRVLAKSPITSYVQPVAQP